MPKVRLKSKQWAGFSSYLGVTKFENGVSVDVVSEREAQMLGSITAVEFVDEEGNATGNAGFGQVQVDKRGDKAPVEKKKLMAADKPHTPEELPVPDLKVVLKGGKADETDEAARELEDQIEGHEANIAQEDADVEEKVVHTRESLEAMADEGGIVALRSIGEELDVRSNSITSLITKILKAQG